MASVTGLTAEKMLEMADEQVIAGLVDVNGHLLLEKRGGGTVDAGYVVGPPADDTPDASTTVKGIVEMAIAAETDAGTSDILAVSPLSMAKFSVGLSIAGGTDLDSLILTGQYHQGTQANATVALHYPLEGVGGMLVVETGTTFLSQTYITRPSSNISRAFVRSKFSTNGWSTWRELITPEYLTNTVVGKRRIKPTSVASSGGTVVIDSDGTVRVSANGTTVISLNDILVPGRSYEFDLYFSTNAANNCQIRFRNSGVDYTGALYVQQGFYFTTTTWAGGGASSGYGNVLGYGLLSVNGGTLHYMKLHVIYKGDNDSWMWFSSGSSRTGGQGTAYMASGDCSGSVSHEGITFIPGSGNFLAGSTIKIWELI